MLEKNELEFESKGAMRIAVTDLKDYVEGVLRFEWLDLDDCPTVEALQSFIAGFLQKRSEETGELHEEWFVTDYEGFVNLGEYPSLENIETAAKLSGQYGWQAVARYYASCQTLDEFEEAYNGTYDSEEDFAYELAHDIYSDEQLGQFEPYIDWEKFARDLFINDYFSEEVDGCVVVFRRL